jgi:hypothetical protein
VINIAIKYKWFIAVALGYLTVRLPYIGFVPIWDGAVYYWFARHATIGKWNPFHIETHNHICFLYTLLMSIPARLNLDSIVQFNLFLTLFTLAGIFAFYKILEFFIGDRASGAELALMTAVFAFQPAVLSSCVHLTLDPGLVAAFLFLILAFLKERYIWAALIGVFLVFTKDTGLLLLPLAPVFAFICYPDRRDLMQVKRAGAALLFPLISFGIYALYKTQIAHLPLFWGGLGNNEKLFLQLVNVFAFDRPLLVQLIQGFVLSFQWVLTAVLIVLAAVYLIRFRRSSPQGERRSIVFTTGLFIAVLYIVTRFRPYSNPRYLLPFYPIALLLLFQLTAACVRNKYARSGMAFIYLALFIPSLYRTLDPVSMKIFGTFDFGKHKMLKMTSLTGGERSGFGRDQLVYNLQFLQFHYMQDYVYERMRPGPDTVIIMSSYEWIPALTRPLRRDSYHMTVSGDPKKVFRPKYRTVEQFLDKDKDAQEVYYFEYPNADNARELGILAGYFKKSQAQVFEHGGYQLKVTRFYN